VTNLLLPGTRPNGAQRFGYGQVGQLKALTYPNAQAVAFVLVTNLIFYS